MIASVVIALVVASAAPSSDSFDPQTHLPKGASESRPPPEPTPVNRPDVSSPTTSPTTTRPTTTSPTPLSPIQPPTRSTFRPPEATREGEAPPSATVPEGELPTFQYESTAPFASEPLSLTEVLKVAVETNIDLANNAIDIAINEANIMAAVGAYDVFLTAGLSAQKQETPQRGSQLTFNTGSRQFGANAGFRRKLETGGQVTFNVNVTRGLSAQRTNFFNPNAPTVNLAIYTIATNLQVTHPLLKGAGIRVNRADIDRAKIARTAAEATRQTTAQTVVHDIILAYWELLYAQRDLENKRRSTALASEQLSRVKAEITAGRRSPLDGRTFEQSVALRESEVLLAENALLERSLNLRTILAQDIVDREVLGIQAITDPQLLEPRPIEVRAEIRKALDQNPQIRQLQLSLASRRIDELVAANQRLPQLDVVGTLAPQGKSVDFAANTQTGEPYQKGNWGDAFKNFFNDADQIRDQGLLADWSISGQLNLTWDVQNRTPKANHQRTLLELKKAENTLKVTQRQISTSVIRASNSLRTAAKRMEVTAFSVDLAGENLDAEKARFAVGRSTSYDVLFRMDELAIAEANALRAQIDYLLALTELQTLTGELLPAYGIELMKVGGGSAAASRAPADGRGPVDR